MVNGSVQASLRGRYIHGLQTAQDEPIRVITKTKVKLMPCSKAVDMRFFESFSASRDCGDDRGNFPLSRINP